MKLRAAILGLATAGMLSGCALDQPLADNGRYPAPPAEGPNTQPVTRVDQTTDNLPQLNDPVW